MQKSDFVLLMIFGLLSGCKGFVAYPDQSGWSHFFLDRKGQVSVDKNGQYRGQLKLELFRPLPVGSRFELEFENHGEFGAANSVVTLPNVTTYRFRSRALTGYQVSQSVSVIVTVYEAGASSPIERIRVILPFAEPKPETEKKKSGGGFGLPSLSKASEPEEVEVNPNTQSLDLATTSEESTTVSIVEPPATATESSRSKLTKPFQALSLPKVSKGKSGSFVK